MKDINKAAGLVSKIQPKGKEPSKTDEILSDEDEDEDFDFNIGGNSKEPS